MMRILLFLACSVNVFFPVVAQSEDAILHRKLQPLAAAFQGNVGIYVHHLKKAKTVSINADTIFPTASMIKVAITSP